MNTLERNITWDVLDLPKEKETMGSKWVLVVKFNADWSVNYLQDKIGCEEHISR